MKIRYFIDYRFDEETGEFQPIGVWMHNPDDGDVDMLYVDESCTEAEEANWVINRLVEANLKTPYDFLEFHQQRSGYQGMRGSVIESVTELNFEEFARAIVRQEVARKENNVY
jgi:hypothetical protein